MYILEVSYGCPSEKYPLNGIFQMDQAKALFDLGHKVIFCAIDMRSLKKWRKWGISEHEANDISVFEFNFPIGPILPKLRQKISKMGFSMLLKKVIKTHGKPDIVHVHFGDTALCIVEACKRANIPYVVTEHSSGINRDDLTEPEIAPMRYVYQNAAAVIAVSSVLVKRIKTYTGVSPKVIPNIIDLQAFSVDKKQHDVFQFISAGSLNKGKGFDVTINAFTHLLKKGVNARLLIMGDGPERQALINLVNKNGIQNNVRFFGAYVRQQFAEKLSESDCFVLASRGETFGVVYAEALACGLPVIATKCGGPEDFVNERNGCLIEIDNTASLTNAMLDMHSKIQDYNDKIIIEEVKHNFSGKEIAKKIENVLIGMVFKK